MTSAPLLCNECHAHPDLRGLVVAGAIRDDQLPPRCILCGFRVRPDGSRTAGQASPITNGRS